MTSDAAGPPSPFDLWCEAEGDPEEYVRLMIEHGHVVKGKREPLPCGWPDTRYGVPADPAADEQLRADLAAVREAEREAQRHSSPPQRRPDGPVH